MINGYQGVDDAAIFGCEENPIASMPNTPIRLLTTAQFTKLVERVYAPLNINAANMIEDGTFVDDNNANGFVTNTGVIAGKDNGKEGKVLQVFPKKEKVLVEGINITKKHQKPQGQTMQGGVIDITMPIHISNVALVVKKKSGRVAYKFDKNGQKYRVLAQTGDEV